ncbi:hypothetical protein Tco_0588148 [Tanacetum coccineum]
MSTTTDNVISAGSDNLPPMIYKSQYNSWQSRMLLYIKGLPPDIYYLVNHHIVAKEIWDIVKLLIEGSELSLQERESKLYDDFDRITSERGETIHSYYLRDNAIRTGVIQNTGNAIANQSKVIRCYKCRDGIDAFDSDVDEAPTESATFMENLFDYGSDVLSEMQYSEQPVINDDSSIEITSDSNVISYDQYLKESENEVVQSTASPDQQNAMRFTLTDREKYIDGQMRGVIVDRNAKFSDFQNQIQKLELELSANIDNQKNLLTTVDVLKKETKAKEDKYIEEIIDLEKKKKALDSIIGSVLRFKRKNSSLKLIVSWKKSFSRIGKDYIAEYSKVLELKVELVKKKYMIEQDVFIELSKSYSKLEKHCISLENVVQQSKENFQNDKPCKNQDAPEFLEQARTSNPSDSALEYACMYAKQIQELLVYVSDTCPSSRRNNEKLVAVTPMNKNLSSEESSSRDVIKSNLHPANQPFEHLNNWTKNHPLDNVIGNPSRSVSTRRQLQSNAIWCYFDVHGHPIPFNQGAGGKRSGWALLCQDGISASGHILETFKCLAEEEEE